MGKGGTKSIVFFHPDLGIGGAERLVVDAAVGLQKLGHKITIFTSHCDPSHCFDEARDGTLDVRVRGNTLVPPSILSRFSILCAILRQLHLLISVVILSNELQDLSPSAFFVDQLSACVPFLRTRFPGVPLLFYCHFPDKLLAERHSWWKKLYRVPFDWLEGWSTSCASVVVVNSQFTRSVVKEAFPALAGGAHELKVVYPCVDAGVTVQEEKEHGNHDGQSQSAQAGLWKDGKKLILSINRFEESKDIGLAIRAFAGLSKETRSKARLVLAGGYDPRLSAQTAYYNSLVRLAESLHLTTATASNLITALSPPLASAQVAFLLSIPSSLKSDLLDNATLLIYTPGREHFGIVPLEAMLAGVPVLAATTGGPKESVVDGQTGWLRSTKDVRAWTAVLEEAVGSDSGTSEHLRVMGQAGRKRVQENFSRDVMARRLDEVFSNTPASQGPLALIAIGAAGLLVVLGGMLWLSLQNEK